MKPSRPAPATIEILADSVERAHCRGCQAAIHWATIAATHRRMCFNSIRVLEKKLLVDGTIVHVVDRSLNHWATCPDADKFRRRPEDRS